VNRAYRSEGGWTHEVGVVEGERTNVAQLTADLAAAPAAAIQALWSGGDLLACVRLEPIGDGVLYVGMLAVQPDLQDQGYGRRLLDHAEDAARRLDCRVIRISVVSNRDGLIAWYERRGYVRTGDREPFLDDGSVGRAQVALDLVILEKPLG